jgi:hypothetical protein
VRKFVTGSLALLSFVLLACGIRAEDAPFAPGALQNLLPPPAPAVSEASDWCPDWCKGWFQTPRCFHDADTKKVPHVVYDCRVEKFCGSACSCNLLARLFGCGCGGERACGRVRTRHVLLKKTVTEECPGSKCVVPHCTDCVFPEAPKR